MRKEEYECVADERIQDGGRMERSGGGRNEEHDVLRKRCERCGGGKGGSLGPTKSATKIVI